MIQIGLVGSIEDGARRSAATIIQVRQRVVADIGQGNRDQGTVR